MSRPLNRATRAFSFVLLVTIVVAASTGCRKETSFRSSPHARNVGGAATPVGAVRGFVSALGEGSNGTALSYWEFPRKRTSAYEVIRHNGWNVWKKGEKGKLIGFVRSEGIYDPFFIPGRSRFYRVFTLSSDLTSTSEPIGKAEWAKVIMHVRWRNGRGNVPLSLLLHRSGGQWRLIALEALYGS